MHSELSGVGDLGLASSVLEGLSTAYLVLKVVIGFSLIIFVHELGHFLAAKWMGVRVDRFAVGFFYRLCGYRRGEGFTFGPRPSYKPEQLAAKGYGETDYCLNALPFGGYVKMLGEDDIEINEETGQIKTSDDPRAFTNKSVGRRMIVVSAGVLFNLLFAIFAYAAVYLFSGIPMPAPTIGLIVPTAPAATSGLRPGDRVLAINGERVQSFEDIFKARLLSGGPVRFRVERDGRVLPEEIEVPPPPPDAGRSEDHPYDLQPAATTEILAPVGSSALRRDSPLKPGDKITHIDGRPVQRGSEVVKAFLLTRAKSLEVTVARPDPEHAEQPETLTFSLRAELFTGATEPGPPENPTVPDSRHLLGLCRRQWVQAVQAGSPADEAGFEPGDVIAQWGNVANPRYSEIVENIYTHDGRPIDVIVERHGKRIPLRVTPRSPFVLFGQAKPHVGVIFSPDSGRPVVADVFPDTPAAAMNLPRGAEILALGDHPVHDWFDVFETLAAAAGTTVAVHYRTGGAEAVGDLAVPSSIVNELDLPPFAAIRSINGRTSATLPSAAEVNLPSAIAVRALLEEHVGQTVVVEYLASAEDTEPRTARFAVRADNTDPWQSRVRYSFGLPGDFKREMTTVDADGNVLRALGMGLQMTGGVLREVYRTVRAMIRNALTQQGGVGVKDVSGPIGIVREAVHRAETGHATLVFFLAFISVNLAVLNFLPIPVVDGGLMVFLILEKLRGKPLSLRIQIITTVAGIGLIVLIFLFVTFQDIIRWATGGF